VVVSAMTVPRTSLPDLGWPPLFFPHGETASNGGAYNSVVEEVNRNVPRLIGYVRNRWQQRV